MVELQKDGANVQTVNAVNVVNPKTEHLNHTGGFKHCTLFLFGRMAAVYVCMCVCVVFIKCMSVSMCVLQGGKKAEALKLLVKSLPVALLGVVLQLDADTANSLQQHRRTVVTICDK